jgi:hypothetical protein
MVEAAIVAGDEDDLLLEPHRAAVRDITAMPALTYINHARTFIPTTA